MHIVTVLFSVYADRYDEFMAAMLRNATDSLELEPGCLQFDVCEGLSDVDDPSLRSVFLYEVYARQDAFKAHLRLPHFLHFNAATAPWVASKTVQTFTRKEPLA